MAQFGLLDQAGDQLRRLHLGPLEGQADPVEDPHGDRPGEILAAEEPLARGGADLDRSVHHVDDRDVERPAAEVEDQQDPLGPGIFQAIGQRRGGRLVQDPLDRETGDLAGLDGCLALGIVEVSGNGDDGPADGLALRKASASCLSERSTRADSSSGLNDLPPDSRRTHSLAHLPLELAHAQRSGCVTISSTADRPTSRFPSGSIPTTEGVSTSPRALGISFGPSPSMNETAELVVPRSIPMMMSVTSSHPTPSADPIGGT